MPPGQGTPVLRRGFAVLVVASPRAGRAVCNDGSVIACAGEPWRDGTLLVPPEVFCVPGMLSWWEKRMLFYLGSHWTGSGAIADMGAFLGGSTIAFAAGLGAQGITEPVLHSYDL